MRKPSHEPIVEGAAAVSRETEDPIPGRRMSATAIPMSTETKAVIANHTSVDTASRAAPVTFRRFATDVTTAVKMSGGMRSLRSWTYVLPIHSRVDVSQLCASAARS